MEKGNARNSTSKTNSEVKKDGNKYSRYARYKPESISPRPDTRAKPNPQKNRESFDKRPRARSGAICERYRNEVADDMLKGRTKQGSKKVSLNHLLNFTLTPVEAGSREFGGYRPNRGYRIKMPKYNKEQFLQANCQFIVREGGDYLQHCKNPDLLVQWSSVEEVRVPSHEVPSCPICLYAPVAAKITRCGHIYCWPCILHYLALTDKTWQKCPICFEVIHSTDLRSVLPITKTQVVVGNKVSMCLMKREKGCMFPVPAIYDSYNSVVKMNDAESITKFQKLLLASKDEVRCILHRELKELEAQLGREENEPEACFIDAALKLLHERELLLDNCGISETKEKCVSLDLPNNNIPFDDGAVVATEEICDALSNLECDPVHDDVSIASGIDSPNPKSLTVEMLDTGTSPENQKGKDAFYFYQAEDGQHIYLHGLNARMLIREFGSLEDSPPVIEAKVLELEKISMTEVLRKRLRYLQHVPLTCEFQVAELNIDHLISEPTKQEFSGQVSKRHKLRNQKAHEERRREKYIQEVENKKMGKYPSATYNLNSSLQFPVCHSKSQNQVSEPDTIENYEMQYPSFGVSNASPIEGSESCSPPATTSFAQMLRDGQVSFNHELPQKKSESPLEKGASMNQGCEDSDDEAMVVPEYRQSFSNAIQAALDTAIKEQKNGKGVTSKKKMKSRVLFTTSMCRNK